MAESELEAQAITVAAIRFLPSPGQAVCLLRACILMMPASADALTDDCLDQEKPSLTSHQQMASLKLSSRKGSSDRVILFLLQMIAHIKEKKRMGDRKRKKK